MHHREPEVGSYRSGFHCDSRAIEGGKFGAKAPPTEAHFCRSGFSRDPCVIENQRLGVIGAALAATLCVIENRGLGVAGALFTATLAPSKTESSRLKPLLQKPIFVGAAFIATLASSRTEVRGESPSYKRSMITEENNRKKWPPGSCWISMRMIGWSALRSKARAFVDRSRLEVKGFPLAQRIRMEPAPASAGP